MTLTQRLQGPSSIILAGFLAAFSFFQICPDFLSWLLPIISSSVLLFAWSNLGLGLGLVGNSPRYAFLYGWLFGFIFFGLGVSWVYVSIHDFGNVSVGESTVITLVFALFLGVFPALHGYFLTLFFANNAALFPEKSQKKSQVIWPYYLLAFPALGCGLELIKSWIFTGFPWLEIGITQIHGPLSGFAPIIGSYGCGLLVYFIAGLIIYALQSFLALKNSHHMNQILNKDKLLICLIWPLGLAILILLSGYCLSFKSWTTQAGSPILVSLIQGNISQSLKWDEKNAIYSLRTYFQETQKLPHSRLILWPETAIPMDQIESKEYLDMVNSFIQKNNPEAALITGIPLVNPNTNQYFNGEIILGNGQGLYQKNHLVPFGEFIPFHAIFGMIFEFLDIPMSDVTPGPDNQPLIQSGDFSLSSFICYEIAYSNYVREQSKNSEIMITLSDDAWFGDSEGPYQHLQIAQMRALENGRYLLNSTNNGITAVITPEGQILKKIPQFQLQTLTTSIIPMTGKTPWEYMGLWPIWISIILMLFIAKFMAKLSRN